MPINSKKKGARIFYGLKFGKLTVVKFLGKRYYECKCDCGNVLSVRYDHLIKGNTKSCGCGRYKHKMYKSRIYHIWANIKYRCNKKDKTHKQNYSDRGIIVCEKWKNSFLTFYKWSINNGYSDNLTIDRIDVNGNYEPSNCRWITNELQQNNKRNTIFICFKGETKSLKTWTRELNLSYTAVLKRINEYGWDTEKALSTPIRKKIKNGNKK